MIDQKNHPIKRAKVKLNGVNTNMVVTTGNDGRYEFTGLAAGKYQIKVSKRGFITSKQTVEVKGGETVELDFQLQRRSGGVFNLANEADSFLTIYLVSEQKHSFLKNTVANLCLQKSFGKF